MEKRIITYDFLLAKSIKNGDCIEWTGATRPTGMYGALKVNGILLSVHRISFELHKGKIPEGLFVCHSCDNKKCFNPDHLFVGTAKENHADALRKGIIVPPRQSPNYRPHKIHNLKFRRENYHLISIIKRELEMGILSQSDIVEIFAVTRFFVYDLKRGKIFSDIPAAA